LGNKKYSTTETNAPILISLLKKKMKNEEFMTLISMSPSAILNHL
jgi:hypothetical protein